MITSVLTSAQMKEADRKAIDEIGIPGSVLMENAARGCLEVIQEISSLEFLNIGVDDRPHQNLLILCGGGNNGGDGLAIARHASIRGYNVTCLLLAPEEKLSNDAKLQLDILRPFENLEIRNITPDNPDFTPFNSGFDCIVDAMLGMGATGTPRSPYREAITWANNRDALRVAVDIPTGLNADTGEAISTVFEADLTVTMAALKPGLLLQDGPDVTGELFVTSIGTPGALYETSGCQLLDEIVALQGLPIPRRTRHKYDRGKVLVLGGSREMAGAAVLTATASINAGAGLVVLGTPESVIPLAVPKLPAEIISRGLPESNGRFAENAFDLLIDDLETYTVIALGPGIGRSGSALLFARDLLRRSPLPIVLDADGLFAFNEHPEALGDHQSPLIITPHHGEMARLLGVSREAIAGDTLAVAGEAAQQFDCIVVLKGAPTVMATPDGNTWINSAGNPGMATAGSGDVLTGVITGLIARHDGDNLLPGLLAGVYLHSLAGDVAVEAHTKHGLTASNIIDHLPDAFRRLSGDE